MSLPQPPKLVLDDFIATALSATPPELHPFFESFRSLYTRKCVFFVLKFLINYLTVSQTMASINSEGFPVLRSSTNTSVSGGRIRTLREGFREQDQPIALG